MKVIVPRTTAQQEKANSYKLKAKQGHLAGFKVLDDLS